MALLGGSTWGQLEEPVHTAARNIRQDRPCRMRAITTAVSSARQHQERACEQQGSQDANIYMYVLRLHFRLLCKPCRCFTSAKKKSTRPAVVAGPEKGKMEQEDARATMGLQDALSLLPQEMLIKMVPTTRTILLRRTSKKMRTAVENAKVDVVVVRRRGVKFRNGEGLLDKLNGLNAWCRVTELRLNECELGEGGAQAIAAALRVKNTVTSLNLETNELGEGGGQAIAAALRENHTLTSLVLGYNSLGEGGACQSTGNCCGTARE
jgi:hypothetical protein